MHLYLLSRLVGGALGLVLLTAALVAPSAVTAQSEASIDTIRKAWKARQDRVRSFEFTWVEKRTEAKGWKKQPGGKALNPNGLTQPEEDLVYEEATRFLVDGDKWLYRFTTKMLQPAESKGVDAPLERVRLFDGRTHKEFEQRRGSPPYPQGTLANPKERPEHSLLNVAPLVWTFRLLDETVRDFDLREMRVAKGRGVVDGRDCVILEPREATSGTMTVWVDPARDWSVVRHTLAVPKNVSLQFDVSYAHDDKEKLWIPSTWKYAVTSPDGSLQVSASGRVEKYAINPRIDPAEFQWDFPLGTWVDEYPDRSFIQRESGGRRYITKDERGATYEQYLRSESGMALKQGKSWWVRLVLPTLGLAGVLAAVIIYWRRRKAQIAGRAVV